MHNFKEQMRWHKALYHFGRPALPLIESKLLTFHASTLKRQLKFFYVSALVQLAHDIDEQEAQRITQHVLKTTHDRMLANRLKAITAYRLEQYTRYEIRGIPIFVANGIITWYPIHFRFKRWFRDIPDADLKDIERISIEREKPQDYLGTYTPILHKLRLVWVSPFGHPAYLCQSS